MTNKEKNLFEKAESLTDHERYEEAIPLYEQLVKMDDNNAKYHYGLADSYMELQTKENYPKADKHYGVILFQYCFFYDKLKYIY